MKNYLLLIFLLLSLVLTGCSASQASPKDLTQQIKADETGSSEIESEDDLKSFRQGLYGFGLQVLKSVNDGDSNQLISPFSLDSALGLTANGAGGETLVQMEKVLGTNTSTLNACFRGIQFSEGFRTANSIWIKDDFEVKDTFLTDAKNYYGASVFSVPFSEETVKDINNWVDTNTDGMIPEILQRLSDSARMVLINACAFDKEWQEPFTRTEKHSFTKEDGSSSEVDMMFQEGVQLISLSGARGFIKNYRDSDYAFVGLKPDGAVADFLENLTPDSLASALSEYEPNLVEIGLPKFKEESSYNMNGILESLGMVDAFTENADFSNMVDENKSLCISEVNHKTFIEVNETGTKAGAATDVILNETALLAPEETEPVILDKPFVYLIVDTNNSIPLFMGIVKEL